MSKSPSEINDKVRRKMVKEGRLREIEWRLTQIEDVIYGRSSGRTIKGESPVWERFPDAAALERLKGLGTRSLKIAVGKRR